MAEFIPRGRGLDESAWRVRHRFIVALLWFHAVVLAAYAIYQQETRSYLEAVLSVQGVPFWFHAVEEGGAVAAMALAASWRRLSRTARSTFASVGLMTCSAVLVHLSGGYIEAHFHFFVMVTVMAMYQHWVPFLVAIVYVAAHHGLVGSLWPEEVYNHASAVLRPWEWAGIHAFFVLAASAGVVASWRFSETAHDRLLQEAQRAEQAERRERHAAEGLARTKAEFLANMSHEIRTPLNAIVGFADLLHDSPLSDEQRDYVRSLRGGSDHLLAVLNDILDYSKIDAGRVELEAVPFDVRSIVEESLDLVSARASEKDIELAYDVSPGTPPTLVGDPSRVRQVLANYLSNAVKFTERGEVVVTVEAQRLPDGFHEAQFHVRDTGIGVAAERVGALFQAFTQGDSSMTRRYGGTGLGLAISRGLAERMGGRAWVSSEAGQGSVFSFSIRVQALEVPTSPRVRAPPEILQGMPVLVVDDNDTHRSILVAQLASWGAVPDGVAHPRDALERINSGRKYGLVLMDYHMPDMNGVLLAREIRRLAHSPMPALVLLSSSPGYRAEAKRLDVRFDAAVMKPLKQAALLGALTLALGGPQREATADSGPHHLPDLGGLNVLLVEDNFTNRRVVAKMLERLKCSVATATNGVEALDALARSAFDIVLMDVQMPVMDGLDATREIHRRFGESRPRVLGLTAHALAEERQRGMKAGMDDFLTKPLGLEELAVALQRWTPRASGKDGDRAEA